VLGWVIYVELIYPRTADVVHHKGSFWYLLENLALLHLFATSVLLAVATAVGYGCREGLRRTRN